MNHPKFTKLKTVALALILTISSSQLFAQTSNGIFFQAVARDNFSNPAKDRSIYVQTTILQTTTTGTKVLIEEHKANTDATGIFSISIGNGTRVGGTAANLNGIDWSKGPFFLNLKVAITPVGGTNSWDYTKEWVDMGTTNFGAVPFSFYAASVAGFDTKLNVADSAKMLLPYAKTTAVNTLSTSVDNKLATKLNIADSTNGYVTPAQLAAKTFDQTPITNAIATKLNIADSTNGYVTPTQLAAKTFDTTSLSNRINLKANASDMTTALTFKASNSDLISGLNLKLNTNQKGVANGVASLNAFGVIPSSQLPPVTLSSTSVVGSELEMISLASATVGSIAIRTDLNKNYVLSATPASTLSNWVELLTPAAPVQTVNGYTGTVNISKNDIGLSDVNNTSDLSKPISTATQAALATKISSADAAAALNLKLDANKVGAVNGVASLNALGKVPTDQIPAISFSSVKVLGSQAEMLALSSAVVGSVVIRTDVNKNYVLSATPASTIGNWIELLTPAPPVQTVNGYTGNISITKTDLGLGNVQNTSDADKTISTQTQSALNTKVDKVTGKELSTNDYTTAEKTKLAAITGTNTGDQDLSSYATNTNLALKANLASPTFTGTVTTNTINTGALSSTSVTAPTFASTPKTLTYTGATINWNPAQGLNAAITLTQNSALSFTDAPPVGSYGTVVLTQDATGSRTITLPSITGVSNKILGSTSTTTVSLSTAANSKDILNFYYDGTNCYWNIGQGYGAASSSSNSGTTNLASSVTGILAVANGGTGSATQNFVDLSTAQTIAGAKTFSSDATVNGMTIGRGAGAIQYNSAFGLGSLAFNSSGTRNSTLGYASLYKNQTGNDNTALGQGSLFENLTGNGNTGVGSYSLQNSIGNNNTSVGAFALQKNTANNNTAIGYATLSENTSGTNNIAQGQSALQNNTTGSDNTGLGKFSLVTNTTGSSNTAVGSFTDANSNNLNNTTAIGYGARVSASNTIQLGADGSSFIASGVTYTTTPISNVKTTGTLTLGAVTYPNTNGSANQVLTATVGGTLTWTTPASSGVPYTGASAAVNLGNYELTSNGVTVGRGALSRSNNYAYGYAVLSSNTTGNYNNAFGHQVLTANTTGQQNSAFGEYALPKNIGGNFNTAMGTQALRENTSGSGNSGFGQQALFTNSTGSNNTALGNQADVTVDGLSNTTAIGHNAKVSTSNTIQLGNTAVTNVNTAGTLTLGAVTYPKTHAVLSGQVLTSLGSGTLSWTTPSDGLSLLTSTTKTQSDPFDFGGSTGFRNGILDVSTAENLATGPQVLNVNTSGIANVGFGIKNLYSNTTGNANTSVGFNSLYSNTTGNNNTSFGTYSMYYNTTGGYNSSFGSLTLLSNTTGSANSAFGEWSLIKNTTGANNTAYGVNTLVNNTTGSNNTAIGKSALFNNITDVGIAGSGNNNTGIGTSTLNNNTTGYNNTALGYQALNINTTGYNNTALGYQANVGTNNLTNATAIGNGAIVNASNTIQLGNTAVTNVNTSGAITAPIYASTPQTLTDAATISWVPSQGLNASVTLAGNRTLSFSTAPASGAYGTLVVKQDATGGRTLTLPSVANKILGSSSTTTIGLSTTANAIDIINFYFDGTNYFWNVGQGYGSASTSSSTATNIAGGAAGSIPYQTGAGATSLLPKGTDGHVLTLASGIPSWSAPTGGSGSGGHYVGEVYGGGIVFYVTTGGYHGLIASSTDIVANPMTIFDRATSPSYKYATNSENLYTDWVTPTFSQLNILYSARATTGLNLGSFFYISSSNGENDAFSFKGLNFSNNVSGTVNGNWTTNGPEIRGRAIRTF